MMAGVWNFAVESRLLLRSFFLDMNAIDYLHISFETLFVLLHATGILLHGFGALEFGTLTGGEITREMGRGGK